MELAERGDTASLTDEQVVALTKPVSTDLLRIDVVDVYAGTNQLVALSELEPLQRPAH